jgi:competence protein ComEA
MKDFKSHFAFNRSQQNGIFLFVIIIITLQAVYFFYPFSSEVVEDPEQQKLVEQLQQQVDSLKREAANKEVRVVAPFNPNFISDYKGYRLGMSLEAIDRLHAYREQDLWINSPAEFQKVTGISDSLLLVISPLFKFPEWKPKPSAKRNIIEPDSKVLIKADLNAATAEELQRVNGIGEKLSVRIVKYRAKIGGFRGAIQLQDVYGLEADVIGRVMEKFEVNNNLEKLLLNEATFNQLMEVPYFDYEVVRALISYRKERGIITSFQDLHEIKGFPVDKIDRIKLYLTLDH